MEWDELVYRFWKDDRKTFGEIRLMQIQNLQDSSRIKEILCHLTTHVSYYINKKNRRRR